MHAPLHRIPSSVLGVPVTAEVPGAPALPGSAELGTLTQLRPSPVPCGRGQPPGRASLVRTHRGLQSRLVIINPDTWRPPPKHLSPCPSIPSAPGLGLCRGDSKACSKNKLPFRPSACLWPPLPVSPRVSPMDRVGTATTTSNSGLEVDEAPQPRQASVSLPVTPQEENESKHRLPGFGCPASSPGFGHAFPTAV